MSKIESMSAVVPVSGQSYTDLRPTISADSIEEYREMLAEVGRLAGNDAFVNRMHQDKVGLEKIVTPDGALYFNRDDHTYVDEDNLGFMTASTFAKQFTKEFDAKAIAPKVADKKLTTPDKVIEGWNMKGEVSLMYGSTVHKALECGIKYGEIPNSPHLAALVQDYLDMTEEDDQVSEQFVADFPHRICGTIDVLVNKGNKHVVIRDFKSSDPFKKTTLTPEVHTFWENLESKMISIYQLQLSFYAYILKNKGYKVEWLEIWYIEGEAWKTYKLSVLDIEKGLKWLRPENG